MRTSHRLLTLGLLLVSAGCSRDELAPYSFPAPVTVDCQTIPQAFIGVPYSFTPDFDASNARAPLTWSAEDLPPGLTINPETGEISGVATTEGEYFPTIIVKDSSKPAQVARVSCGKLVVVAGGVICTDDSGSIADGILGEPYTFAPMINVGVAPYTWEAVGLPMGLTLDPASGLITGTPTEVGQFQVTLIATDATGAAFETDCGILEIFPRLDVDGDKLLEAYPDGCVGPGVSLQDLIDNGVLVGGDGTAITCELRGGLGNGNFPAGISVTSDTCQIQGTVDPSQRYGMYVWITSFIQGNIIAHVPYCAPQSVQPGNAYTVNKTFMGAASTLKPGTTQMNGGTAAYGVNTPDPRVEVLRTCSAPACFFKFFFGYNTLSGSASVSASMSGKLGAGAAFDGFFHGINFTDPGVSANISGRHWVVNIGFDYCITDVEAECATKDLAIANGEGSNYEFGVIVRP
jgi:hypothetical protein